MSESPDGTDASESDEHGPVKPFLEHLEDLRWVLVKVLSAVGLSWAACFSFSPFIMEFLQYPLKRSGVATDPSRFLTVFSPMEAFSISFQLALYSGLVVASPLVIYFIASYALPALTGKERRLIAPAFWLGALFFLAGVAFCYFVVLPPSLAVSVEFTRWLNLNVGFWTVESYVSFVTKFMLGMGIAFEMPLVILVLVRYGVLNYAILSRTRRYAIVIIAIVSAVLTPPDVASLLIMSLPLILMYEACIWIAWLMEWKEKTTGSAS